MHQVLPYDSYGEFHKHLHVFTNVIITLIVYEHIWASLYFSEVQPVKHEYNCLLSHYSMGDPTK